MENFTKQELLQLRNLNQVLIDLEQQIKREVLWLLPTLKQRLNNHDLFLTDFEIIAKVDYILRDNDPAYDPDSDNILVTREYLCHRIDQADSMIAGSENWNAFQFFPDHPMKDDYHCWLFHELYEHSNLSWNDLLRIESLWLDIDFRLQHEVTLKL